MKFITKSSFSMVMGVLLLSSGLSMGGEGTLPFGKGNTPFSMIGRLKARDPQNLYLKFMAKRSSASNRSEAVDCPSWLDYHNFAGTIRANKTTYTIVGICASEDQMGERIVTGVAGRNKLILEGVLEDNGRSQVFSGTATVITNGSVDSYSFTLTE